MLMMASQRPSGLRKTNPHYNSLAHRTLWRQFQARLRILGMSEIHIEFGPAIKPLIDQSVQVVNYMLARGLLRIGTSKWNELHNAL